MHPQPWWSAFRESSYGHGAFDLVNSTHAHWVWHRNDDGNAQVCCQHWNSLCARDSHDESKTSRLHATAVETSQVADAFWLIRDLERCPPRQSGLVAGDDEYDDDEDEQEVEGVSPQLSQHVSNSLGRRTGPRSSMPLHLGAVESVDKVTEQ